MVFATFAPKVDVFAGSGCESVVIADFNADGRNDLAVTNFLAQSEMSILLRQ